ncbi:hypothetical protein N7519_006482 [Penicillium mononematosum]|uniref:uncharacterized protein n=1 Tax=Penicillium mononematosum TaxID=268346 RepID=UPI002546CD40|nr:uncharacterized protein N7519_006482 [Penicillium mononematosum]KAJ6185181.1 hypothetical protein N7519_006482 [Penicillium mononematosum]
MMGIISKQIQTRLMPHISAQEAGRTWIPNVYCPDRKSQVELNYTKLRWDDYKNGPQSDDPVGQVHELRYCLESASAS